MDTDTTVVGEKCTRNDNDNDTTEVVILSQFYIHLEPPPRAYVNQPSISNANHYPHSLEQNS